MFKTAFRHAKRGFRHGWVEERIVFDLFLRIFNNLKSNLMKKLMLLMLLSIALTTLGQDTTLIFLIKTGKR
mgnify:FL=1